MRISNTGMRSKSPIRTRHGSLLFAIALNLMFLGGCGRLAYVAHLGVGQFRLIQESVPVAEALQSNALSDRQKDRLRLVAEIKDFGENVLGLKSTENYQTVHIKSADRPLYVVSACPKDRLVPVTWWFPIVGRVPYLGFFDRDKAEAEKRNLIKQNLDVNLGMADAYSTLGWFRDPITLNLLDASIIDLANIILHEMTHVTIYAKDQGEFNEGVAVLVGKFGAYQFFESTFGPSHPLTLEAKKSINDERVFSAFLGPLFEKLEKLYGSHLDYVRKVADREEIFTQSQDAFRAVKSRLQTDRFLYFGRLTLNNAVLISIGLYHRHFRLFESILKENDGSIKKTLSYLKDFAVSEGNPIQRLREQKLD